MKYLLNNDFKVIRKGSHVSADDSAGEMIFDTDSDVTYDEFTMGMMQSIVERNKLRNVGGKTKKQFFSTLTEGLKTMTNVAEQNGPTETEIAKEIITEGFEEGKTEDEMMVQMVTSGISFKKAMKLFKDVATELGFIVATKEVKETAAELLEELNFNPETYDHVQDMLEKIRESTGGTDKQAMSAIRAYAKENEIAIPKKATAKRGATGYTAQIYKWMLGNPEASESELSEYIDSIGKDAEKLVKKFLPVLELCREFAKQHGETFSE